MAPFPFHILYCIIVDTVCQAVFKNLFSISFVICSFLFPLNNYNYIRFTTNCNRQIAQDFGKIFVQLYIIFPLTKSAKCVIIAKYRLCRTRAARSFCNEKSRRFRLLCFNFSYFTFSIPIFF